MNEHIEPRTFSSLLRVTSVTCVVTFMLGCGAIKNSLKPWVCDCEPEKLACADGSVPKAVAATEPEETGEPDPETEDDPIESDEGPSDAEKQRQAILEATDFIAIDARRELDEETIEKLESDFGLRSELSADYHVFVGAMTRKSPRALAVLKPGDEIQVFAESGSDAEREWKASVAAESWIPAFERPAEAARMVDDKRLELVVQEVIENEDGTARVEMAVYKVIGIAVARVFAQPVATRAEDGSWAKSHDVRILKGERARWIEVTATEGGEPVIYRWNHWEGMFRIPRPVPTAPDQQKKTNPAKQPPVSRQDLSPLWAG